MSGFRWTVSRAVAVWVVFLSGGLLVGWVTAPGPEVVNDIDTSPRPDTPGVSVPDASSTTTTLTVPQGDGGGVPQQEAPVSSPVEAGRESRGSSTTTVAPPPLVTVPPAPTTTTEPGPEPVEPAPDDDTDAEPGDDDGEDEEEELGLVSIRGPPGGLPVLVVLASAGTRVPDGGYLPCPRAPRSTKSAVGPCPANDPPDPIAHTLSNREVTPDKGSACRGSRHRTQGGSMSVSDPTDQPPRPANRAKPYTPCEVDALRELLHLYSASSPVARLVATYDALIGAKQ